jgi:hypothetical protein
VKRSRDRSLEKKVQKAGTAVVAVDSGNLIGATVKVERDPNAARETRAHGAQGLPRKTQNDTENGLESLEPGSSASFSARRLPCNSVYSVDKSTFSRRAPPRTTLPHPWLGAMLVVQLPVVTKPITLYPAAAEFLELAAIAFFGVPWLRVLRASVVNSP